MRLPADQDPRPDLNAGHDIRPIVGRPSRGLSDSVLAFGAILIGLLLFGILDARRRDASAPAVTIPQTSRQTFSEPPPLYLREMPQPPTPIGAEAVGETRSLLQTRAALPAQTPYVPPPYYPPPAIYSGPVPDRQDYSRTDAERLAPDGNAGGSATSNRSDATASTTGRVSAGIFANGSTTVIQGTLIPAVLETALDSTRGGFARALVQRDIRGFDGSRVLIPRGSRIIGEYSGETSAGQNRAIVAWSRLIRPDGATIAIGSPATDPLGRGGIRAKVDSHFFERFAGAILQSSLDVGVNLASRAGGSPVIVALPGTVQNAGGGSSRRGADIPPTLSVKPGTSISVFVARDLDFTSVELGR